MTRICELSFGLFTADVAAGVNLFDVLAHTWGSATAARVEFEFADVLWRVGLDAARTVIGTSRDLDHYDPEIQARLDAGVREQFLGFLGRPG
jgi:hypothetical protein